MSLSGGLSHCSLRASAASVSGPGRESDGGETGAGRESGSGFAAGPASEFSTGRGAIWPGPACASVCYGLGRAHGHGRVFWCLSLDLSLDLSRGHDRRRGRPLECDRLIVEEI